MALIDSTVAVVLFRESIMMTSLFVMFQDHKDPAHPAHQVNYFLMFLLRYEMLAFVTDTAWTVSSWIVSADEFLTD